MARPDAVDDIDVVPAADDEDASSGANALAAIPRISMDIRDARWVRGVNTSAPPRRLPVPSLLDNNPVLPAAADTFGDPNKLVPRKLVVPSPISAADDDGNVAIMVTPGALPSTS